MAKPSAIALRQERFSDLRRTMDGGGETVSTRFQTIETRPGFVQLLQESNKMHLVLYEQQQEPYLPTQRTPRTSRHGEFGI